jgi:hypothetical protein
MGKSRVLGLKRACFVDLFVLAIVQPLFAIVRHCSECSKIYLPEGFSELGCLKKVNEGTIFYCHY